MDKTEKRILKFKDNQFRAETIDGVKKIRGYPILFNVVGTPYRGSDWKEIIDPNALADVNFSELRLLVDHDTGKLLARSGINLRAEIDNTGLFIEASLPNTTLAADTWELVNAGIMDGMSFMFLADQWETNLDTLTDTILHMTDVPEISLVTFPAYQATVAIAVQDTNNQRHEKSNEEDEARKKAEAELNLQLSIF